MEFNLFLKILAFSVAISKCVYDFILVAFSSAYNLKTSFNDKTN